MPARPLYTIELSNNNDRNNMTVSITLEAKPYEYSVQIPGFGLFTVHRLGAGVQADLADKLRAAEKYQKKVEREFTDVIEREKQLMESKCVDDLAKFRASDEYRKAAKAQGKANAVLQEAIEAINKAELALWSSDDPKALEKLMTELTLDQIRDLYAKIMEKANQEEVDQ